MNEKKSPDTRDPGIVGGGHQMSLTPDPPKRGLGQNGHYSTFGETVRGFAPYGPVEMLLDGLPYPYPCVTDVRSLVVADYQGLSDAGLGHPSGLIQHFI